MKPTTSYLRVVGASADAYDEWLAAAGAHLAPAEREALAGVLSFVAPLYADRKLPSGVPIMEHALGAGAILAGLRLDQEALAAAVLFHCHAIGPEVSAKLRERFGRGAGELAEGVMRMGEIEKFGPGPDFPDFRAGSTLPPRKSGPGPNFSSLRPEERAKQLEALRKMLLAMVQDVRIVMIKLGDHVQALREAVRLPESEARLAAAQLARDIFAPLANRLGVWQLKWELEDLAFRILDSSTYQRIARLLDEKRADRERYLENVIALLRSELNRAGIEAEVTGRPKHIFSIHEKMRKKGADFEAVYDVRAVRVLVRDVSDCYAVLGLVHNLWSPMPKEFDDYIAKPKSNRYRSLHTGVIGPEGKGLEVQIRTHEMHQDSELGVAAHWRYKEGSRRDRGYDEKIAWLRQVLEWKDSIGDQAELAEQFRTGLFTDTLYVLTPQGKVIDLPRGATPIDFAYHVHTELGHRCRGAKVNGAMVPLNRPLANGQQVEIVAAKQGGPSRDWLNASLGYVVSPSARARVRQWFNRQNFETAVAQGRAVVEKELQRLGMTSLNLEKLAAHAGFPETGDFLAEVGRGDIGPRQLQQAIREMGSGSNFRIDEDTRARKIEPDAISRRRTPQARGSVLVVGVARLLTVPARCCRPAPPDAIVGFITRGRGVTIHRAGCVNVRRLARERVVSAAWGESAGAIYPVDVDVHAADRRGLRREIADVLARERINIAASSSAAADGAARMRYTLEVADLDQLQRALALIREVRGVSRAARR